jgi:transposase
MEEERGDGEVYVGIDVSKAELVMAVRPSGERAQLANNASGIKQLVARLRELQPRLVVVEATGGLQRQVVAALWAAQIAVAVVNPAWVRHFAKGRGLRGKTDSIDADLLALYAERERPEPRPPADAETAALQALVMRR